MPIWNFFEKPIDGNKIATCNYCHRELSFKTSVTNLKQHLRQKHISVYNILINIGKNIQSTAPETVSNILIEEFIQIEALKVCMWKMLVVGIGRVLHAVVVERGEVC